MRASIVLVVMLGLFACGQAVDLKEVGSTLVNTLVDQGKKLLTNVASQLLSKLNLDSLTSIFGKRDLKDLFSHLKQWKEKMEAAKNKLHGHFSGAMDKLKEIKNKFHSKLGMLKDAKEHKDAVDKVVGDYKKVHKRILTELFQTGVSMAKAAYDKAKGLVTGAAKKLKAGASWVVSTGLQKATDLFVGKRATLSDHLQTIGSAVGNALSPFKDLVSGVGNTLKGHFSNLVDTVKGHYNTLKGKLSGHVDDIKKHGNTLLEHGKNALGALSEVVKDILQQTLTNAKPAIDGLTKTVGDAAKTVGGHFAGTDGSF